MYIFIFTTDICQVPSTLLGTGDAVVNEMGGDASRLTQSSDEQLNEPGNVGQV